MTVFNKVVLSGAFSALVVCAGASQLFAAQAYPVATDINAGPAAFGARAAAPTFGGYGFNSAATLNGNAVLGINQGSFTGCCHGAVLEINVSNGENGDNGSPDLVGGLPNTDVPNATPANSVFAAIGNASGKLENGNVIRFSAWFRADPATPITTEPQVAPIMKIEYWKEGLSGAQDSNAVQAFPQFGDRMFDQDQQGYALTIPDLPTYVDIDHNGSVVHDPAATSGNGRLFPLASDHWELATVTHTVNTADWLGIGAAAYGAFDVTKIESIRGIMFLGNFDATVLTAGTLLVDNAMIEVFKNTAAVTPINNPNPALSEVTVLQGDYNNDHFVDAADYTIWRNNLGAPTEASLNGNGDNANGVDAGDYTLWKSKFGTHSPGSGGIAGGVPEPASLMLLALAAAGICAGSPRRR